MNSKLNKVKRGQDNQNTCQLFRFIMPLKAKSTKEFVYWNLIK